MIIFTIIGVIVVIWFIVDHTGKSRSSMQNQTNAGFRIQTNSTPSQKGIEYNKLAMAFNGMYLIINEVESKTLNGDTYEVYAIIEKELMMVAYMYRINIIDRIEKYRWDFNTPIVVPNLSEETTTLENVYNATFEKLTGLADVLSIGNEIKSILKKGDHFYKTEDSLPEHIKLKLNEGL
jgi:hypothetical protein